MTNGELAAAEAAFRDQLAADPMSFEALEGLLDIAERREQTGGVASTHDLLAQVQRCADANDRVALKEAYGRLRERVGQDVSEAGLTTAQRYNLARVMREAELHDEAVELYTDVFTLGSGEMLAVRALVQYSALCLGALDDPRRARNALRNAEQLLRSDSGGEADELRRVIERGLARAEAALGGADGAEIAGLDEVEAPETDALVSATRPAPRRTITGPVDIFELGGVLVSAPAAAGTSAPPATSRVAPATPLPPSVAATAAPPLRPLTPPPLPAAPPTTTTPGPEADGPDTEDAVVIIPSAPVVVPADAVADLFPAAVASPAVPPPPPPRTRTGELTTVVGDMDSLHIDEDEGPESGIYTAPFAKLEDFADRRYRLRPIEPYRILDQGLVYRYDEGRSEGVLPWERMRFMHAGNLLDVDIMAGGDGRNWVADIVTEVQITDQRLEVKAVRFSAVDVAYDVIQGGPATQQPHALVGVLRMFLERAPQCQCLLSEPALRRGVLPTYPKTDVFVNFIMAQILRAGSR
jgi:hypothetical protein